MIHEAIEIASILLTTSEKSVRSESVDLLKRANYPGNYRMLRTAHTCRNGPFQAAASVGRTAPRVAVAKACDVSSRPDVCLSVTDDRYPGSKLWVC